MNRRGFFGTSLGAAAAGQSIATDFAKSHFVSASSSGVLGGGNVGNFAMSSGMDPSEAVRRAFKLGLVSREHLAALVEAGGFIEPPNQLNLDADLQSAKSFSLATRLRMQRERNSERAVDGFLHQRKSVWDHGRELLTKGLISDES
jgi:hypothetical protein